jgi:colicin import membrane protein
LDGIEFNERDFYQQQAQGDNHWKLSLNLAVAVHVLVFLASVFLPGLIERRPLLDNIVTVDLVSMPEPSATPASPSAVQPAEPPKQAVQQAEPQTEPENAEVSVAPEPEAVPRPAAPAKPISLKPLKRKIRKAKDTRLAEEKEQERLAKKKKQEALARKKAELTKKRAEQARRKRAIAEAKRAELEARRAAARARQELASVIRTTGVPASGGRSSGSSSGRKVSSVVLNQYLSTLYDRVHSYWVLPEMRTWDRGLETVVVLVIRRDGSVADMQVERKSRDPFFDRFVLKTLQNASPMPPFPALMSQASIEVGLRFKPGELAM